jgi:hypothetical protein
MMKKLRKRLTFIVWKALVCVVGEFGNTSTYTSFPS